ncbi:MAG: glycosyl hydrolase 115 family protein, partial [Halanaerobiales bacterium]
MIFFRSLKKKGNDFSLVENGSASSLFFDKQDYWGVKRAVGDLADDIERISGIKPVIDSEVEVEDRGDDPSEQKLYKYSVPKDNKKEVNAIFIGTIGKSKIIDKLIDEKRIDVLDIAGKWESSVIQVIDNPVPGVNNGLVIAGSDKRGTIFAIYELSQLIGVSPWYWWADVPVKHRDTIYVKEGTYKYGEPSVKYRGIFLNDEAPSLTTWVEKRYGTFNHNFYEKVFELLLRLKANYLWPAMWKPRVFNEEDPLNPKYADKYGIVMGTSHHEPMMRSWEEWGKVGEGPWNYKTNRDNIYRFWQEGLSRVKDYEGIVTVGMRGDGDKAMEENGSIEESKRLLEKVVEDQREIISNTFNEDASAIPQLIALYKEVQGFYEKGLNIPDDITLLLADDNFANIRMLPTEDQRDRHGGYGMYYHFDYVGGPRSYQWINTVPLQKIWEQMRMTYDYGVDRIWIVNVGDLKPMELPIDFFLEMAWDIDRWNYDNIKDYALYWIEKQFGQEYSEEIADILLKYTKYNGRRKPELLVEDTYSLINYREAERVLADFDNITGKAECIYS